MHIEQPVPGSTTDDSIATFPTDGPSNPHDDATTMDNVARRDTGSPVLTMFRDPLGRRDSTYLADAPTLRVGMHLGRNGASWMWTPERGHERAFEQIGELFRDDERTHGETRTKSKLDTEPKSPVSRRELMREFLGESSGAIL